MNANEIGDRLQTFWDELSYVRKLVFFQKVQIEELQALAVAHLATSTGKTPAEAWEIISQGIRTKYDKMLLRMGDTQPEIAADIDIRKHARPEDLDKWLFPDS